MTFTCCYLICQRHLTLSKEAFCFEDLRKFLSNDELHLIHLLSDNVKLAVKLENQIGELFKSKIGSPQGDAASALFSQYTLPQH